MILEQCDELNGVVDGIVADTAGCQQTFDLGQDVPTCDGSRDGTCLTAEQETVLGNIMTGARNSSYEAIYASFLYDPAVFVRVEFRERIAGVGAETFFGLRSHRVAR